MQIIIRAQSAVPQPAQSQSTQSHWRRRSQAGADSCRPAAVPGHWLALSLATFALLTLFAPSGAWGKGSAMPAPVRLADINAGSLLFRTGTEGVYLPAPAVRTDVRMTASGLVNRVEVSQRFYNPTDKWLEGVYVFPLPEGAAVDHLRLRVGERLIEGKIKKREEAKRIYDRAKEEGRKASLIEQERPNIFTNAVANIAPGEDVVVQIEYQETLRYESGGFSLRFPMVIGPRYIPGASPVATVSGTGWAINSDQVRDADRITPPVRHPSKGKINPVAIEIVLDPGFPISFVRSPSHKINVAEEAGGNKRTITLDGGTVPADRDFVLEWQPDVGAAPAAGLFTEGVEGETGTTYAMLMMMPPLAGQQAEFALPREVIYVIDTSGSMGGRSIRQAREALSMALLRLRPRDSFNVIQFNSVTSVLFPRARAADITAIEAARNYVANLTADGGTNMLPALQRALSTGVEGGVEAAPGRLRQVIFMTDGAIGNEAELLREVKSRLGRSRLFTIGIGSAPNSYFMSKAAEYGHGTFTYIGDLAEVKAKMSALFAKLEAPVMTDIAVAFPNDSKAEAWPRVVPDLYQGEPVVVAARLTKFGGKAVITGRVGGQPWRVEMPLGTGRAGAGIGALWARRKIAGLMDSLHEGADIAEVKPKVTEVALAHHLVSKFTSLVAVDVTPSRPADATLGTAPVATNLPHGWDYDKVFGASPGQRKRWDLKYKAQAPNKAPASMQMRGLAASAAVKLAMKSAPPKLADMAEATDTEARVLQQLPRGATPSILKMLIGFAALLLAAIILVVTSWPSNWPTNWAGRWRVS